ncbi:hypothetical protein J1N35_025902, partial [Gossypium stocksii]
SWNPLKRGFCKLNTDGSSSGDPSKHRGWSRYTRSSWGSLSLTVPFLLQLALKLNFGPLA